MSMSQHRLLNKPLKHKFSIVLLSLFTIVLISTSFINTHTVQAEGYTDSILGDDLQKQTQEKNTDDNKKKNEEQKEKTEADFMKDCKALDISCHFNNLIISFTYTTNKIFASMLKAFVIEPESITQDATMNRFFKGFQTLTGTLLTLFFIFKLLQGLTQQTTENDPTLIKEAIKRAIIAGILTVGMAEIFTKSLEAQKYIISGIAETHDPNATGILHILALSPSGMFSILLLIYAILFLVIGFQYVVRWADLALMYVLLPVVIPTIMNDEHNYFGSWVRQFLSILITQCVQTLLIAMMFRLQQSAELFNVSGITDFSQILPFIYSLGMAWCIMKSPAFVKEILYTTGVSGAGKSGAGKVLYYMMMKRK